MISSVCIIAHPRWKINRFSNTFRADTGELCLWDHLTGQSDEKTENCHTKNVESDKREKKMQNLCRNIFAVGAGATLTKTGGFPIIYNITMPECGVVEVKKESKYAAGIEVPPAAYNKLRAKGGGAKQGKEELP